METPKELYISIERTYETKDGTIIGMVMPHESRTSDTDIEYLRSDLAVDREKLVAWLGERKMYYLDIAAHSKENSDFYDGIRIGMQAVVEKLKEL